jgi:nucleoside-diphosphate-sugar epimerase
MRVLITGGAGFVGRHFVKRLLDDGHDVRIIDDLSSGVEPKYQRHLRFSRYDIRLFMQNWLVDYYDLIIHCAAIVGGRLNIDNNPLAVATNLAIDSEFFNAVVKGKVSKQVIYFSSSAVYPLELQTLGRNCDLAEPLAGFNSMRIGRPDMTYGWSKLTGEYLAKIAAEKYGLDVKIYRPFGGYGEDQDFNYPFPSIIKRVIDREDPVTVWGSGEQQRDFIHIDDIVEAVLATKDKMAPGEVMNLGTGVATSFRQLAIQACKLLKHPAKIINDIKKPEGVFRRVADTHKMLKFYTPKVTLEQGIIRVAEALQKQSLTPAK